jgi:hypothetical protein
MGEEGLKRELGRSGVFFFISMVKKTRTSITICEHSVCEGGDEKKRGSEKETGR